MNLNFNESHSDEDTEVEYIRTIGEFFIEEEGKWECPLVNIISTETKYVWYRNPFVGITEGKCFVVYNDAKDGCLRFDGNRLLYKRGKHVHGDKSCEFIW